MSPSDATSEPAPAHRPSPEVVAIAVALAALWPGAADGVVEGQVTEPSPWRWGGRRWERPTGHRWS
jgi:hypothetical protein